MKEIPKREAFLKPVLQALVELGGSGTNDEINNTLMTPNHHNNGQGFSFSQSQRLSQSDRRRREEILCNLSSPFGLHQWCRYVFPPQTEYGHPDHDD